MLNLFKRKKKNNKPQDGAIYAVHDGNCKGQMLLFVECNEEAYGAIAFPEMDIYNIPIKDVTEGLEKGIIDYVEHLPKGVFELCSAEYEHRKKLVNLKKEVKQNESDN